MLLVRKNQYLVALFMAITAILLPLNLNAHDSPGHLHAAETDTNTDGDVQPTYTFSQDELTEEDLDKGVPVAASVQSREGLQEYIRLIVAADGNLKSVTTNEQATETVYLQRGKLLGIIPVWMKVKTVIKANGAAYVWYPWYKFITKTNGKVTSEMILEKAIVPRVDFLTVTEQATAIYSTQSAFILTEAQ